MQKIALIALPLATIFFIFRQFGRKFYFQIRKLNRIRKIGEEVEGVVISFEVQKDAGGMIMYFPRFSFTYNGENCKVLLFYPEEHQPAVGEKRVLLVDPDNPADAVFDIDRQWRRNIVGILVISIASLLLLYFSINTVIDSSK